MMCRYQIEVHSAGMLTGRWLGEVWDTETGDTVFRTRSHTDQRLVRRVVAGWVKAKLDSEAAEVDQFVNALLGQQSAPTGLVELLADTLMEAKSDIVAWVLLAEQQHKESPNADHERLMSVRFRRSRNVLENITGALLRFRRDVAAKTEGLNVGQAAKGGER